jgi:CRISPR-associated endoribonuclease Cas6
MLASLTLHLRPTHYDEVPVWLGRATQAWFLDSLRQVNPVLSKTLHDGSALRPFTLSSLIPPTPPRGDLLQLSPHETYTLRLTTLHADVSRITLNALVERWLRGGITLHEQPFHVERIDPLETTTYQTLLQHSAQATESRIRLRFESPTVFHRTGGIPVAMPLPDLVFGSLLTRWNTFAPQRMAAEMQSLIRSGVRLEKAQTTRQTVTFERSRKGAETGFVGDAVFCVDDPLALSGVHALAAYAPYCGAGVRTTVGLGQVTLLEN